MIWGQSIVYMAKLRAASPMMSGGGSAGGMDGMDDPPLDY